MIRKWIKKFLLFCGLAIASHLLEFGFVVFALPVGALIKLGYSQQDVLGVYSLIYIIIPIIGSFILAAVMAWKYWPRKSQSGAPGKPLQ
jgi:hypothetical protein